VLAMHNFRFFRTRANKAPLTLRFTTEKGAHMKRLTGLALGISLMALGGVAQAANAPARQEGRIWIDSNLTLLFSPNWSLTTMPGARVEFARSREDKTGLHFLEFFFGPNYTYKTQNLTIKGSLWYYYMGYPSEGRQTINYSPATDSWPKSCKDLDNNAACDSTYNFSHNLEIIPAIEYRLGRWSFYDRIIFHNTFYADYYNGGTGVTSKSPSDLRWGWGTVLRELVQTRYAVTDRLGVSVADEVFFGIKEDGDTHGLKKLDGTPTGYHPTGYWKNGYRLNRIYAGIDYKVTPTLTVAPMYTLEIMSSPTKGSDVTDVTHTLFMVVTYVVKLFDDKK
jgi:hypothetical protein